MDRLAHRKAKATITILDESGLPSAGAKVRLKQTGHDFLFGCGVFEAVALQKEKDPTRRAALSSLLEKWLALFNYGTLPFYWGRYEPEEGQTDEAATMAAARALTTRGVTLKGHPLCWHTVCAPWLLRYSNEEILSRQLNRIRRELTAFRGIIDFWDVINEVVIMPEFDKYDNAVTRICKSCGRVPLVRAVFDEARVTNPQATLLINDFNTSSAYEHLIEDLLDAGVPVSAIGIQSHQHQGYWGRDKVEDVLMRFSRFGLPLHFTENTLISGDLMPGHIVDLNDYQVSKWPSTAEGEARQCREIVEMYSLLFEHPSVQAITAWDFRDDAWLHAPAGLIRVDGSPKPAYEALMRLIHGSWETDVTLNADELGIVELNGFKGTYRAEREEKSTEFELHEDCRIALRL